jgi:hypothetical protein
MGSPVHSPHPTFAKKAVDPVSPSKVSPTRFSAWVLSSPIGSTLRWGG